ncbi:MarR family winged helix-turn-helix transcriptional regulator [Sciscionella marina]|uniref:MarR family winged helix-turn-helix transcriptional regulator n=1 Tax=Sciscionella marina TaxID=508770 RepID=UPI00037411E1|nr:MarR family transcriptional regulator [Sciscionella marina]
MVSSSERVEAAEALDGITRFVLRQTAALRELSFTAVSTLSTLDNSGRHRLTELAQQQGVSQPSMTTMIARLQRQGLVCRETDPMDGRSVLIAITPKGRELLARRQQSRRAFLCSLIGDLDESEVRALVAAAAALRKLVDPEAVPMALAAARAAMTESIDHGIDRGTVADRSGESGAAGRDHAGSLRRRHPGRRERDAGRCGGSAGSGGIE